MPGYKHSDVGVIPEDWDVISIGELFTFKNGLNKEKNSLVMEHPLLTIWMSSADPQCVLAILQAAWM